MKNSVGSLNLVARTKNDGFKMKFALVDEKKVEAKKGVKGFCQVCGSEMIPKICEKKADHWAHKSKKNCDHWWENEKEWHRSWKNEFPEDWQEIVHFDQAGEKHVADVKTNTGLVVEFQHSYLNPEERRSRNDFYKNIIWLVDGTRRPTDIQQFETVLKESSCILEKPMTRRVSFPEECRLISEWADLGSFVFFDFNKDGQNQQDVLWFVLPSIILGEVYISWMPKSDLVRLINKGQFETFYEQGFLPHREKIIKLRQMSDRNQSQVRLRGVSGVKKGGGRF